MHISMRRGRRSRCTEQLQVVAYRKTQREFSGNKRKKGSESAGVVMLILNVVCSKEVWMMFIQYCETGAACLHSS